MIPLVVVEEGLEPTVNTVSILSFIWKWRDLGNWLLVMESGGAVFIGRNKHCTEPLWNREGVLLHNEEYLHKKRGNIKNTLIYASRVKTELFFIYLDGKLVIWNFHKYLKITSEEFKLIYISNNRSLEALLPKMSNKICVLSIFKCRPRTPVYFCPQPDKWA